MFAPDATPASNPSVSESPKKDSVRFGCDHSPFAPRVLFRLRIDSLDHFPKKLPQRTAGWPFRISRNATGRSKAYASMARANLCRSRSGAATKTDPSAATMAFSDFCGIALASSVSGSIYLNERTRRPASNFCAPLKSMPIRQPTPDSRDRAKTAAQPERRRGRAREAQCPLSVSFFPQTLAGPLDQKMSRALR
jgi:hypothetical protein